MEKRETDFVGSQLPCASSKVSLKRAELLTRPSSIVGMYKYIRATRIFYSDASVLAPKSHSFGILIAGTVRGYIQSVRYLSFQHTCCTEGKVG